MKRPAILAGVGIVLLGIFGFIFLMPHSNTLDLSGLVQAKEVKNASRFGGRVKSVLVKEGDVVKQGQQLIIFDDLELQSKITQARAALAQAAAKEGLIVAGPDSSDVRQASAQVQQAQDNVKLMSRGARPEEITQGMAKVQDAQGRFNTAKSSYENSIPLLKEGIISQQKFDEVKAAYESSLSALNGAKASLRLLKTGARAEQVHIAQQQLIATRAQYDKLVKGARPGDRQIASAAVKEAQSVLEALENQLSETVITAPISGVVTILNITPGELVMPNRPVISILDNAHLWSDIYIPESQLGFVEMNQEIPVTAPSFPGATFSGRVALIDPKASFVPGGEAAGYNPSEQPSFRVKIEIESRGTHHKQLLPGMNIDIHLDKKKG